MPSTPEEPASLASHGNLIFGWKPRKISDGLRWGATQVGPSKPVFFHCYTEQNDGWPSGVDFSDILRNLGALLLRACSTPDVLDEKASDDDWETPGREDDSGSEFEIYVDNPVLMRNGPMSEEEGDSEMPELVKDNGSEMGDEIDEDEIDKENIPSDRCCTQYWEEPGDPMELCNPEELWVSTKWEDEICNYPLWGEPMEGIETTSLG